MSYYCNTVTLWSVKPAEEIKKKIGSRDTRKKNWSKKDTLRVPTQREKVGPSKFRKKAVTVLKRSKKFSDKICLNSFGPKVFAPPLKKSKNLDYINQKKHPVFLQK